jgi:UDP-N-acetylmuramate--alanine ligase
VLVIDDYAHHPTEIEATLAAVAEAYPRRSRFVIFQPHRYTRTRDLGEQFGPALRGADHVVVTSVYSAGEEPIAGVDARRIVAAARQAGVQKISYVDSWEEAVDLILPEVEAGDLVLTLGAGDVWKAGDLLAARIAASPAGAPVRLSEEVE